MLTHDPLAEPCMPSAGCRTFDQEANSTIAAYDALQSPRQSAMSIFRPSSGRSKKSASHGKVGVSCRRPHVNFRLGTVVTDSASAVVMASEGMCWLSNGALQMLDSILSRFAAAWQHQAKPASPGCGV